MSEFEKPLILCTTWFLASMKFSKIDNIKLLELPHSIALEMFIIAVPYQENLKKSLDFSAFKNVLRVVVMYICC